MIMSTVPTSIGRFYRHEQDPIGTSALLVLERRSRCEGKRTAADDRDDLGHRTVVN
jgi:hypothetical protein